MINFFNFDNFKGRTSLAVRERARKRTDAELRLPVCKDLFTFVCADKIDLDTFAVTSNKDILLRSVENSEFRQLASTLASLNDWFQLLPAEWVVNEFAPLLERLPVQESIKQSIYRAKTLVKIQVTENFDSSLSGFQLLNFVTAQFAKKVRGLVFEPCSFKLYRFDDPILKQFDFSESELPSLFPFLSVLSSTQFGQCRLTTHGLHRFGLPEFQFENVSQSMCSSSAYLMNALAQSLIGKVEQSKARNVTTLSLDEPYTVSTNDVIRGNKGNLPFDACIPGSAELGLKLREQGEDCVRLVSNWDSDGDKTLADILSKLSLI
ncbi:MAG: hypothetical protein SGJ27_13060 [Candidatus Melainabacteria bacterium]|nr:hypothetical protein [Candidatus Melainabacteria bacterium]